MTARSRVEMSGNDLVQHSRGYLSQHWKREIKCGARTRLGPHPNASATTFDHPATDCQAETRAGNLIAVEPLKNLKDLFVIMRIDSNAVVVYCETPFLCLLLNRDVNPGRGIAAIFDRIVNKILEKLLLNTVCSV